MLFVHQVHIVHPVHNPPRTRRGSPPRNPLTIRTLRCSGASATLQGPGTVVWGTRGIGLTDMQLAQFGIGFGMGCATANSPGKRGVFS